MDEMTPLAIDLYCGLGGWTEGLLAEGYDVIGFDNERHVYGDQKYPAQLVLQNVLTLHGKQFKDASLIVASPPCQEFSYMAMPWSLAKKKQRHIEDDPAEQKRLTALFDACFRIQREAIEAAGHFIPLVVENVKGAQKWVGRARWNYGSFYLWGDVPALMPMTKAIKVPASRVEGLKLPPGNCSEDRWSDRPIQRLQDAIKNNGDSWFNIGSPGQKVTNQNPVHDGTKGIPHRPTGHWTNSVENGSKGAQHAWFNDYKQAGIELDRNANLSRSGSKSTARKAASARIAKIPLTLARHIARAWWPREIGHA